MIKISAVSYLNTKPFIFGLESLILDNKVQLFLDFPSECANKLINKQVDVGLVPVAAIPSISEANIISSYCIGSDGPVNTVMLYSEVPLHEIKVIYLDYQSRTSVNLIRVLADKYWKINPEWRNSEQGYEKNIKGEIAGLVIGDRAFDLNDKFKYVYDLAQAWKEFTGLPFVFACWVSVGKLTNSFIASFNDAIAYGVKNIDMVLDKMELETANRKVLEQYFKEHISYEFSLEKRKALELFLNYIQAYSIEETHDFKIKF